MAIYGFGMKLAEADSTTSTLKIDRIDDKEDYPGMGGGISIPLMSKDGKEPFILV